MSQPNQKPFSQWWDGKREVVARKMREECGLDEWVVDEITKIAYEAWKHGVETSAKTCEREWKALGFSDSYPLLKKHIPVGKNTTQLEVFAFINQLMKIRAQEIRALIG